MTRYQWIRRFNEVTGYRLIDVCVFRENPYDRGKWPPIANDTRMFYVDAVMTDALMQRMDVMDRYEFRLPMQTVGLYTQKHLDLAVSAINAHVAAQCDAAERIIT